MSLTFEGDARNYILNIIRKTASIEFSTKINIKLIKFPLPGKKKLSMSQDIDTDLTQSILNKKITTTTFKYFSYFRCFFTSLLHIKDNILPIKLVTKRKSV